MQSCIDLYSKLQSITVSIYLEWMKKHKLIPLLYEHRTLESIFIEKSWPTKFIPYVQEIFDYLVHQKLLIEGGGTYKLVSNKNSKPKLDIIEKSINQINTIDKKERDTVVSYLEYGLDLINQWLDKSSGKWASKNQILFEFGNQLHIFQEALRVIYSEILDSEINYNKVLIYARYHDFPIIFMNSYMDLFESVYLLVNNTQLKKLNYSFCELKPEFTKFEVNFRTIDELDDEEFDLIIIVNGLGIDISYKKLLAKLSKHTKYQAPLFAILPLRTGIPIIYPTHPNFVDFPKVNSMSKFFSVNGFYDLKNLHACPIVYQARKG